MVVPLKPPPYHVTSLMKVLKSVRFLILASKFGIYVSCDSEEHNPVSYQEWVNSKIQV